MFCRKCGHQIADTDEYCPFCGVSTSVESARTESTPYFSPPARDLASSQTEGKTVHSSNLRFSKTLSSPQGPTASVYSDAPYSEQRGCGVAFQADEKRAVIPAKKHPKPLAIAAIIGGVVLLVILAIVLIPKNTTTAGGDAALSKPTGGSPNVASDHSDLCGSWNYYTGGTLTDYGAAGAEVTTLQLNEDGSANLFYYITNSGVGSSYEGVWSATKSSGNNANIDLKLRDYSSAVGEDRGSSYRYNISMSVVIEGNTLEISSINGDLYYLESGMRLENGLSVEDWTARMKAQGYWKEDGTTKELAWDITGTWDGYNTNYGTGWYELEITVYSADQETITADWAYTSTNLYGTRSTVTGDGSDIWVIEYTDEYLEIGVKYDTALTSYNRVFFYSDGTAVVEISFVGTGQMTHTPLSGH